MRSWLRKSGYNENHIAIYGENSYEWIVAYFAVACSGNVVVPVDKDLSPTDVSDVLIRAKCKAVFYSAQYTDEIAQAGITDIALLPLQGEYSCDAEFTCTITTATVAAIVYTSGTTGKSKGVVLSHGNLASDVVNSSHNLFVPEGTVLLLPLHHTFGMMAGVLCQLFMGYPVFINLGLRYLKRDIGLAHPGHLSVVPLIMDALLKSVWDSAKESGKDKQLAMLVRISNGLRRIGIDLRKLLFRPVIDGLGGNLTLLISGGSAIKQETVDGLDAFGIKMINGYGITECSPIVATTRNKHNNFPSVGTVVPCCRATIHNPDANGEGEIYLKGDIVFQGYYDDEHATDEAFDGDWFKTGDIGRLSPEGFLYITGRVKNLIILSNGENVSPELLENALSDLPGIVEVIVYAQGDRIFAEIFPDNDMPAVQDTVRAGVIKLNASLPTHHRIADVVFRDSEFPKTTTKKIKRSGGKQQCQNLSVT